MSDSLTLARVAVGYDTDPRRIHAEPSHAYRNPYQRDRDRITHCSAFRRLEYKTQVFAYAQSDYYRSRLTHTLEVAQIARTLARALNLNEDLTEAIALAHDIGHPPFGHAGENVLNSRTDSCGGFNHNRQGLRIVDKLERRYARFPGLNLSFELRESFAKHGSGRAYMPDEFVNSGSQPPLEAQVVDIADEIAYNAHDLDDGLAGGLLQASEVNGALTIWADVGAELVREYGQLDAKMLRVETVRKLINLFVNDVYETTSKRLDTHKKVLRSPDDVRQFAEPLVTMSEALQPTHSEIKAFLRERLYAHHQLVRLGRKAEQILGELFDAFETDPRMLPDGARQRMEIDGESRTICDYLAGMTDRFAIEEYQRMFGATVQL